jgi:hypothetical protein
MRIGEQDANILEHAGLSFSSAMGGYETPGTGSFSTPGEFILFIMLMFYANLIALNTLIAILGDSYDNVRAEESLYDMKEKTVLLKELSDFYVWNRNKVDMCFLHIIRYVSEGGENSNVWEGKIKQMSNMIKNLGNRLDSKFASLRAEIKGDMSKLAKMDAKIDEIKNLLTSNADK